MPSGINGWIRCAMWAFMGALDACSKAMDGKKILETAEQRNALSAKSHSMTAKKAMLQRIAPPSQLMLKIWKISEKSKEHFDMKYSSSTRTRTIKTNSSQLTPGWWTVLFLQIRPSLLLLPLLLLSPIKLKTCRIRPSPRWRRLPCPFPRTLLSGGSVRLSVVAVDTNISLVAS